jgi:hypothetical protein
MVRRQVVRGMQAVRAPILAAAGIAAVAPSVIALIGQDDAVGVQAVQSPPPDRRRNDRTGTGVIKGIVVDGQTGQPVGRARVRLLGTVGSEAGMTGTDGAFSFSDLPPGEFAVQVEKSTFMASRYPDGTRSIRASHRGASLSDGEVINLVIPLHRGGSIAGRVFDAHGDLVEGARVSAFRTRGAAAGAMKFSEVRTNDLGEFRVARLQPGTYFLLVAAPRVYQSDLTRAATPSVEPVPTYYPSAISIGMAHPLHIPQGQSLTGIDVVLAEAMASGVDGVVVRRDGAPASAGFVNARLLGQHRMVGSVDAIGAPIRPDGTFRFTLPPGEYRLEARITDQGEAGSRPTELTGQARLSVTGNGVETVAIAVGRPATASGRIIFEGAPPPSLPSGGMPLSHIPLESVDEGGCRFGQVQINADWSFTLDGLSGTCAAPPMLSFGRWRVKSVLYRGRDLLEQPLTIGPEQHLSGVQVVITDKQSGVLFRVSDGNGQATREYVALVFPTDKSRWRPDGRFVRVHAPLPQTLFERLNPALRSGPDRAAIPLEPGDYLAVALDDITADAVHDPALLERLIPAATRVILAEGARQEVVLRRVSLSDLK